MSTTSNPSTSATLLLGQHQLQRQHQPSSSSSPPALATVVSTSAHTVSTIGTGTGTGTGATGAAAVQRRVFIPGILPAPRCRPPIPQPPPPPPPQSASPAATPGDLASSEAAETESSARRPRHMHLISVLRRSATATTDLATPAISETPSVAQPHHVRITEDQIDPRLLMPPGQVAAAAEGPASRTRSQRPPRPFSRSASAPMLIPSYSSFDLLSSTNSSPSSGATASSSSIQDSDVAPTPSIPLTPEQHADHTGGDDVANSGRRESAVSTCPTFQSALAASFDPPNLRHGAVSPGADQPANYGTITDPPRPEPPQPDADQRARHPSASATLTTTPSLGHSSLSLPESLPTHSSSDRTLTANQTPHTNVRKSPSSLLRTLLSPCLAFTSTCTGRSSSASSTAVAAAEPAPLQVAFASQVLLRWHRPHHAGDADARKSRKETKMVFWREYRAYLLVDPSEPVNNEDDGGAGSTRAQIVFCDLQSLSPTYPIHTLPLHTATLALHAPSDLSLSIHPSPDSSLAWILHSPSLDVGVTWYRAILRALPVAKRPPVPPTVQMYLPDAPGAMCAVQVPVDMWEATVAEVAGEALRVLADEANADTPGKVRQWVCENRDRLQVAWRRGDRLWWIPHADANSGGGGCAYVVGPWFIEQSHVLELRLYPVHSPAPSHDDAALAEGYLLRRSIPGTTKLTTAALSLFSTWETRFAMQVGDHGRFLCFSRYPASHAPLAPASSPRSPATANLTDTCGETGAHVYAIHPHPASELSLLLTSTRLVDLLDIVRVHIHTPCADCPTLFARFRALATHAAPGTPLVTLALAPARVLVPSTSPTAATFSLHTAPPTSKTKRVDRGCELAAGSHAGMHEWVKHVCCVIEHVHRARFAWGHVYAGVLAHNQRVLDCGLGGAVDLVADPRMWPAMHGSAAPVLVAHQVDLKSTYRAQFRPALLVVTAAADVLVCARRVAVSSAKTAEARSGSRRVSGVYKVVRRIGLAGGRAHVLVGYVNAKSGVSAVDEMWGEVVGRVWDEEGLGFAADGSSTDEESSEDEDEDEDERDAVEHGPVASSSATSSPTSPAASADHPPPITAWLPNTHPPVATVHEGPHQTCFTLWVPPRARDVMKRRRRKGKVYVVECRRKAVRDQFLVAIQEVLRRTGAGR